LEQTGIMKTIRIGLIADTHGLLRPEARVALKGVDRILHAGDICNAQVLEQLEQLAPVVAVRGNNDKGAWAASLHDTETLEVGGVKLHVIHDLRQLKPRPQAEGIQVVISGHSHKPAIRREHGILFVNPGSAGPRRFRLPISVGFLEIEEGVPKARLQTLEVD
jgi:putative phosphoesterase